MKLFCQTGRLLSRFPYHSCVRAEKDFTLVSVDFNEKKRLENGDDYFAVNPKGQVPVIAAGRWYFFG